MGRNDTITYLKALGIILMVLGHSGCSIPYVVPFLYMFHMPLFFFASGYCFKQKYLDGYDFLWKRIKSIYWPYVKYGFLFMLLHNLFFDLNIYNDTYGYNGNVSHLYNQGDIINAAKSIILLRHGGEQLMGGFWFLASLFWASIISWLNLKLCRNIYVVALVLFITCIILNKTVFIDSCFHISSRVFAAAFLFVVGYMFAQHKVKPFPSWSIVCCLVITFIGSFFWKAPMNEMPCSNKIYIPYALTAILSVWSIFSLIEYRRGRCNGFSRLLLYIGDHTLVIFIWHFLSFKIVSLLIIEIYKLPLKTLACFPVIDQYAEKGWWGVYFVIGIFIPLFIYLIFEKINNYAKSQI